MKKNVGQGHSAGAVKKVWDRFLSAVELSERGSMESLIPGAVPGSLRSSERQGHSGLLELLLVCVLLGRLFPAAASLLFNPDTPFQFDRPTVLPLLTSLFIAALCVVNRMGYCRLAALFAAYGLSAAVFGRLFFNVTDTWILSYLVVPVIVASMFLSKRLVLALVIADLAGLFLLPFLLREAEFAEMPIIFFAMASALILFGSRHRDVLEKRAQAELRENAALLQALMDHIPDSIYFKDRDLRFTRVNRASSALLGLATPEEAVGKDDTQFFTPEYAQRTREQEERIIETGEPLLDFIEEDCLQGGRTRWVSTTQVPILDTSGQVTGLVGISRDVTERKRAEEAYQAVVDHSLQGLAIVKEGEVLFANEAFAGMAGYTLKELLAMPPEQIQEFFHPDDREMVRQRSEDRLAGKAVPDHYEIRGIKKDGSVIWVEIFPALIQYRNEPALQVAIMDITERKRAEEETRKFKAIFDNANYGSAIANLQGDIEYVNTFFASIHGYTPEESIGRNLSIFHTPEQLKTVVNEAFASLAEEGSYGPLEVWHTHRDGTEFPMLMTGMRMEDPASGHAYIAATAIDITRELELEAQLRQAQKMEAVGQLAGGVAHDFNNLLQAILGYGDLALDEAGGDTPVRASIEEMLKAGRRARTLVSQLLAFSRRQVLDMRDVDLNDVVTDMMKMIRRILGEHIALETIAGHGLGIVRADPGQIEQILMNLCVNAHDAMPEGGTITIETKNVQIDESFCKSHAWAEPGSYALLSVTDSGCGMDDKTLANVFDPFFTTKELGHGTGLGLATVYGLVKQHQGMVHVYSEVAKGTAFKVYLPLVERAPEAADGKIETSAPGGSETILLAEDDVTIRELSQSFLESAGYTVLTASDGEEALHVFDEHADEIDLALLDVMMPKLGGRAVFNRIREARPGIRVLFSSGYSMNAIHTSFVLDEGLQLLQKPYPRDVLLQRVREVLDGSGGEIG